MPLLAYRVSAVLFAITFLMLSSSCQQKILRMQVDNISRENLASYQVGTPDPRLIYPSVGQRMIISWYIPKEEFNTNDISIKISIVYGNHTKEELWYKPQQACGMYVRALLNEQYFEKCGILTYKSEMYACDQPIKYWKHHLWTELISFDPLDDEETLDE
jgi:hypothetical protein